VRAGGVGQEHSRQRALLDICSEAAYPRHHNCLIESIPRGSYGRHGSRFGPFTPTSPAPALPAPSRPHPANPCTNSPPAPGRELGADTAARGLLTGAGWLSLQRSERGGKSVNVHKRCPVDYHLGGRACGSSDRERQQPARSGYWGTILATRRERLVSPDLYLLDSPAGAIHRRGKAELHLVASG
jgi:hypothetical protein